MTVTYIYVKLIFILGKSCLLGFFYLFVKFLPPFLPHFVLKRKSNNASRISVNTDIGKKFFFVLQVFKVSPFLNSLYYGRQFLSASSRKEPFWSHTSNSKRIHTYFKKDERGLNLYYCIPRISHFLLRISEFLCFSSEFGHCSKHFKNFYLK